MIFARRLAGPKGLGATLVRQAEASASAVSAVFGQKYYTQTDIVNTWRAWVCPGGATSDGACSADGTSAFPASMLSTLQPCPGGGTVTGSGGQNLCYGQLKLGRSDNNDIYTMVPGIFNVLGVLFSVAEIQSNKLVKTVNPTSDMRLEAELRIIATSWYNITQALTAYDTAHGAEAGSVFGIQNSAQSISSASINAVMAAVPDFTYQPQTDLSIPFNNAPILPTSSELTSSGGYNSWLKRGGFPLSKSTIQGQRALIEGFQWGKAFGDFDTEVNTSISVAVNPPCNCNGVASQQTGTLTNTGIQVGGFSDTTNKWWTFATINSDSTITVTYAYQDTSWWQDVGQGLEAGLQDLGKLGCAAAPALVKVPGAQPSALVAAGLCVAALAQGTSQAVHAPITVATAQIAAQYGQQDAQTTTPSAAQDAANQAYPGTGQTLPSTYGTTTTPIYQQPLFWIGVGALVLGGAVVMKHRKEKAKASQKPVAGRHRR